MSTLNLDRNQWRSFLEILGKDIRKITKEKAGVISKGAIVISAEQTPEVKKIIIDVVKKEHETLNYVC